MRHLATLLLLAQCCAVLAQSDTPIVPDNTTPDTAGLPTTISEPDSAPASTPLADPGNGSAIPTGVSSITRLEETTFPNEGTSSEGTQTTDGQGPETSPIEAPTIVDNGPSQTPSDQTDSPVVTQPEPSPTTTQDILTEVTEIDTPTAGPVDSTTPTNVAVTPASEGTASMSTNTPEEPETSTSTTLAAATTPSMGTFFSSNVPTPADTTAATAAPTPVESISATNVATNTEGTAVSDTKTETDAAEPMTTADATSNPPGNTDTTAGVETPTAAVSDGSATENTEGATITATAAGTGTDTTEGATPTAAGTGIDTKTNTDETADTPTSKPQTSTGTNSNSAGEISSTSKPLPTIVALTSQDTAAFTQSVTGTTEQNANAAQATSTVAANYFDQGSHIKEGTPPVIDLNKAEVGDAGAYEVNIYAQWVAAGHQMTQHQDTDSNVARPPTLPICPSTNSKGGRNRFRDLFGRQQPQATFGCSPPNLDIYVHFVHVVPGTYQTDAPLASAKQRAIRNLLFLRSVAAPLNIEICMSSYDVRVNADFTSPHRYVDGDFYAQANPITQNNAKFMRSTRKGGADELTVWIVDDVIDVGDGEGFSGYGMYPNAGKNGPLDWDGIVIKQSNLSPADDTDNIFQRPDDSFCDKSGTHPSLMGGTLVHEFGHWMGLKHVFEGNCGPTDGDGVADTNQVGSGNNIQCCFQKRCNTDTVIQVRNWMSYSSCRGLYLTGNNDQIATFTDGQRSRMFAHFLKFRQKKACNAPYRLATRSSTHPHIPLSARELQHREDQGKAATVLADLLLNNCSVAIQDVFQEDSIPMDPKVLGQISSMASVLQATPTAPPPGLDRPQTITWGKTSQPTDGLSEAVFTNPGQSSSTGAAVAVVGSRGGSNGGVVAVVAAWVIYVVFGVYV